MPHRYTKEERDILELMQVDGRNVAEDVGGFYRLEGDDHWHIKTYGPGGDVSMLTLGPGPSLDPRPIGPCDGEEISDVFGEPDEEVKKALESIAKKKK